MAQHSVVFYSVRPEDIFGNDPGVRTIYTGPATATGEAAITDNATGRNGSVLSAENRGETARADVTIGGKSSTGAPVEAKEAWTLRDMTTGEVFRIVSFVVEDGGAKGTYLLSERPMVVGRSYETIQHVNDPGRSDPTFRYSEQSGFGTPPPEPSGAVDPAIYGTGGDDAAIAGTGSGDTIYGGADRNGTGTGDDTIRAGLGSDTVFGGDGNDSIDAGEDEDIVHGGDGDDVIDAGEGDDTVYAGDGNDRVYGGADHSDAPGRTAKVVEAFRFDQTATEQRIHGGGPGAIGDSVVYRNVGVGHDGTPISARITITGMSNPKLQVDLGVSATSPIYLNAARLASMKGATVSFRVEFLDGNGNPVTVDSSFTFRDIDYDPISGRETITVAKSDITSWGVSREPASNVVVADNGETLSFSSTTHGIPDNQNLWAELAFRGQSSLDFTVTSRGTSTGYGFDSANFLADPVVTEVVVRTDDVIDLGEGDDTGYGQGGDDTICGGAGNDTLDGGTGRDTLSGGDGDDRLVWTADATGESLAGDAGTDSLDATQAGGLDIVYTGADGGTIVGDAGSARFSGIERFGLGSGDDRLDASAAAGGVTADGGAGDDSLTGGAGDDSLTGGAGWDTVSGGGGDDTIAGGAGYDVLDGGRGADIIYGGEDADTIFGGAGDSVAGGEGGVDRDRLVLDWASVERIDHTTSAETGIVTFTSASGGGTLSFSEIEEIGFRGVVDGSAGGDTIAAGYTDPEGDQVDGSDGSDDTILAGAGNDSVNAGLGSDTVYGGAGNDTLAGGEGADTLFGGAGNDRLMVDAAGAGGDSLSGDEGNDLVTGSDMSQAIDGGSGDDTISGDSDASGSGGRESRSGTSETDTLSGGDGNDLIHSGFTGKGGTPGDILFGGTGDDTLTGGSADDTLFGGSGRDSFILTAGGGSDRIEDFEARDLDGDGRAEDRLDVSRLSDIGSKLGNGDGTVTANEVVVSGGGGSPQILTFPNGERVTVPDGTIDTSSPGAQFASLVAIGVPPCFAPGTLILTGRGPMPVEELRVGDLVQTADHGLQPIRWIGRRVQRFEGDEARHRPIEIAPGALGGGLPRRRLIVSPQHRVVLSGPDVQARFGRAEVLAPAKAMIVRPDCRVRRRIEEIAYFALLLDRHEVIFAEGARVESFRPGPIAMAGLGEDAREQIRRIYPGLRDDPVEGLGPAARLCLTRREAAACLREADPRRAVAEGPSTVTGAPGSTRSWIDWDG